MLTSWPHRSLLVFAMLTVSAVAARAAEETVLLRPKFSTGRAYYVERITETEQQMKGGQFGRVGMKSSIRQVSGLLERTRETSPERTVLDLTFKKIAFGGTLAMLGELHFDSDQPEDDLSPVLAPIFRPMLGMKVTVELDRNQAAVRVRGGEKIVAKIEQGKVAGNMLWPELREGLSNEALKGSFGGDQFVLMPNREVKVGERWTRSAEYAGVKTGPLEEEYEVTLEKTSNEGGRRLAHLSYTGTVKQVGPPLTKGPAEYQLKSGTLRGTAVFDCELGRIIRREENQQKTLLITIAGAGDAGKIEIAAEVKQSMTLSPTEEGANTKSGKAAKKKATKDKPPAKKKPAGRKTPSANDGE